MRKTAALIITAATCIILSMSTGALAVDYSFKAPDTHEYYGSTYYEDVYGSEYNYGGFNLTDFDDTSLLPGIPEYSLLPIDTSYTNNGIIEYSPGRYEYISSYSATPIINYPGAWEPDVVEASAYTAVDEMKRADGSVGTLNIPSLYINMNAYSGTGSESMNRGLGHFDGMSGWNGNIGLCGHNRGALYTIGSVKDLDIGDTLQYTTVYGTRTYSITFVGFIANNDWSYLSHTADNRITLITCLADQPALRVCVQATEVK